MTEETQFLNLIKDILNQPNLRTDRTGVGIKGVFGKELRFNLTKSFPLLTTRRMNLRLIFEELMWFLRGETDSAILEAKKVNIWKPNTTQEFLNSRGLTEYAVGDIGATYGFQYRHWGAQYRGCKIDYTGEGYDQVENLLETIRNNPTDRRLIINLWNPLDHPKSTLPPCCFCFQFYVTEDGGLITKAIQRSSDILLAGGWNIASAALFTHLIANVCGLYPKELIWSIGDVHIYKNQLEQASLQVQRTPNPFPTLTIRKHPEKITDFTWEDLNLENYHPQEPIKIQMNA
jgi:thymidylate synthase